MQAASRPIREIRFAAIDFESAGATAGKTDTPIQIGIAVMENGEVARQEFFRSYLRSDSPVVWQARKVHGILDSDIADAPTLLSLWPEIRQRLEGAWILAHSGGTERRFLRAFPFHGFGPWVDTLQMTRALFPSLETYDLASLAKYFALEEKVRALCPGLRWHDALFDAAGSLALFSHLLDTAKLWENDAEILLSPTLDSYYQSRARKKLS